MFEKESNIILYLATSISNLTVTKLLKLIYLADEQCVRDIGAPMTSLDYKVWKYGPVSRILWTELRGMTIGTSITKGIELKETLIGDYKSTVLIPKENADLDFLSKKEEEILNNVVKTYGHFSATDLVAFLHKNESLWSKEVKTHAVEFETINASNISINFRALVSSDPYYSAVFDQYTESLAT